MTFNEFNRLVNAKVRDEELRKILVFQFEQHRALAKEFEEMTRVLMSIVHSTEKLSKMTLTFEERKRISTIVNREQLNNADAQVESVVMDAYKERKQ